MNHIQRQQEELNNMSTIATKNIIENYEMKIKAGLITRE